MNECLNPWYIWAETGTERHLIADALWEWW